VAERVSQMNTNNHLVADPRIREALNVIYEFALGNLKARGTISEQNDDLDALITGINVLGEEMEARIAERRKAEEEISRLNEDLKVKMKELIETQEELVRKEKLATLGQLSGSVGHELRNPMGVISNAVYFLQTVMPDADETVREYLGIIKSEVNNSQRIITDLLDFTRTKTPQTKVITVDELIKQCLEKCAVPANVTLRVEISDTLPEVKVDPLQMKQVIENLVTNAVQAMLNGGSLTIRAEKDRESDALSISVADTGEGISPENMSKLFHPLFTTKARGIGLGLTVVKNLIEANGGRIEVESESGKGTIFTVILPAIANRERR
jgi:signal transduction histidine kinase